mmetsp:Transcript_13322/g.22487  ORF Transcript_13322/g.22487 Transcript_13322/m.22487 type:complete len:230 (+) Transcript_13322:322-1011(+)
MARNTTALAISWGSPGRPRGVHLAAFTMEEGSFSRAAASRGVRVTQGATQFTRMPSLAHSQASTFVSCMTAAFDIAYALPEPVELTPAADETFTTVGRLDFTKNGCTALHRCHTLSAFVFIILLYSSLLASTMDLRTFVPALLTKQSRQPSHIESCETASKRAARPVSVLMSAAKPLIFWSGYKPCKFATVLCTSSLLRAVIKIQAPRLAISVAVASPIPFVLPVTNTL